ncbi:MAG: class A beta-lactamase [Pyrinomonadaceae bacterium]
MFFGTFLGACNVPRHIPTELPTPPPAPRATPAHKLVPTRDRELEKQFAEIAASAKGRVGAAAVLLETGDAATLDGAGRYPSQSVYKLPIAMAVMEKVALGELDLDEIVRVTKEDMVRIGFRSPLRDEHPEGGDFSIRQLMDLSITESDGTASDVLLRLAGGPNEVQSYLTQIGIHDVKVVNSEKEISRDWETQYEDWATPEASVELLRNLKGSPFAGGVDDESLLIKLLAESEPGERRIKGLLPDGSVVAHKTGTSGTQNGIHAATNDIGIIYLPNGKRIAIAVYVSDSKADNATRERVIAEIAKAVWDKWYNSSATRTTA